MGENARIEELRRRVQMDPASIAFAALAEEYRRAGRFEEAIATCRAGLQRHPAYLSARVTLGRALLEMGQFDEAREELEHVLRTAPENLAAIRGLAEIHHRRGEIPEALEQYKSALQVAKHDTELESALDELAKEAPAPEPDPAPAPPISLASSTPAAAATTKPAPKAPPLELVSWVRPEAEANSKPPIDEPIEPTEPIPPLVTMPAAESRSDPTLAALEDFLAAILRERERLAVGSDLLG
jgi:tetratricopeptide (TPR) repeat protein